MTVRSKRSLKQSVYAMGRLADPVFLPRERKQIEGSKEVPVPKRRGFQSQIIPLFILNRTSFPKRMGEHSPIII